MEPANDNVTEEAEALGRACQARALEAERQAGVGVHQAGMGGDRDPWGPTHMAQKSIFSLRTDR